MASTLLRNGENIVSSAQLCDELGVSRQAIWKAVQALREEGFPVEAVAHRGYRVLPENSDALSPTWISCLSDDLPWGGVVVCLPVVESTQVVAKDLARQGAAEGTLVLAEEQTSGRGRKGRFWHSPPGCNVYMSLLLRPSLPPSCLQLLSLVAGIGVRNAVEEICGAVCDLKWPNDLLYQGRKICGILSEGAMDPDRIHYAVVGIGVNVAKGGLLLPEEVCAVAATLEEICGGRPFRRDVVVAVLRHTWEAYRVLVERGPDALVRAYGERCTTLGKDVRIETEEGLLTGIASAISHEGALIVDTENGRRTFASGDVVHVRPAPMPTERG